MLCQDKQGLDILKERVRDDFKVLDWPVRQAGVSQLLRGQTLGSAPTFTVGEETGANEVKCQRPVPEDNFLCQHKRQDRSRDSFSSELPLCCGRARGLPVLGLGQGRCESGWPAAASGHPPPSPGWAWASCSLKLWPSTVLHPGLHGGRWAADPDLPCSGAILDSRPTLRR